MSKVSEDSSSGKARRKARKSYFHSGQRLSWYRKVKRLRCSWSCRNWVKLSPSVDAFISFKESVRLETHGWWNAVIRWCSKEGMNACQVGWTTYQKVYLTAGVESKYVNISIARRVRVIASTLSRKLGPSLRVTSDRSRRVFMFHWRFSTSFRITCTTDKTVELLAGPLGSV